MGKKVELFLYENIVPITIEGETVYEHDMYFGLVNNNRDEIISGFIHLKYSVDKEIALMHKGRLDPDNAEYLAYLDYREEVKVYVGK
ncbi:MAG: hypothetical protein RBR94_03820 [Bacilli bacterium]|nr:hypothetical protein [Bacilli bacterium]